MNLSFAGQRVLILGGTSEIGIALAGRFWSLGLTPIISWHREITLETARNRLTADGVNAEFVQLDLFDRSSVDDLVQRCDPAPDLLVDLAQADLEALVGSVDPADLNQFFQAHLAHRALILRQAARIFLTKGRGRAVLVSSAAVERSNPGQGFYAAVKRGAEALYRNLGIELASRGITTTTLRPGYVDAGRGRRYLQSHEQKALSGVPLKRALSAEEVADALVFLASENAVGFNATELTMDGGLTSSK